MRRDVAAGQVVVDEQDAALLVTHEYVGDDALAGLIGVTFLEGQYLSLGHREHVPGRTRNESRQPTALVRTPYGRGGAFGTGIARPLAERGYQVVIQSTRGGFGSGGTFDPMRQERADGMSLETPVGWGVMVSVQERRFAALRQFAQERRTARALRTLPLASADVAASGVRSQYVQDVLAHDATATRWAGLDHTHRVASVTTPVSSIAGWYDIFLPGQLRDFRILREAGNPARLTVGPWTHVDFHSTPSTEAIGFGLAHARGEEPEPRPAACAWSAAGEPGGSTTPRSRPGRTCSRTPHRCSRATSR